jgi:hypothetical protein
MHGALSPRPLCFLGVVYRYRDKVTFWKRGWSGPKTWLIREESQHPHKESTLPAVARHLIDWAHRTYTYRQIKFDQYILVATLNLIRSCNSDVAFLCRNSCYILTGLKHVCVDWLALVRYWRGPGFILRKGAGYPKLFRLIVQIFQAIVDILP